MNDKIDKLIYEKYRYTNTVNPNLYGVSFDCNYKTSPINASDIEDNQNNEVSPYYVNYSKLFERFGEDVLRLEISSTLIPIFNMQVYTPENALGKIASLRQDLADLYGYIIPNIRILDSAKLSKNAWSFLVRGKVVSSGELTETEISEQNILQILKAVTNNCIKYVHQIMSKKDVLKIIELVKSTDTTLVNDLVPIFLSAIDLKKIFANLIEQKVSIKDILFIFEILNDKARYNKDIDKLTEVLLKELDFVKI